MSEQKTQPTVQFGSIDKFTLAASPSDPNIKVLTKNGAYCKCHKVTPLYLQPEIIGAKNMQVIYEHCNSLCTRFEIGQLSFKVKPDDLEWTEGAWVVRQTCEGIAKQFILETEVKKEDLIVKNNSEPQSTIINP